MPPAWAAYQAAGLGIAAGERADLVEFDYTQERLTIRCVWMSTEPVYVA